MKACYALVLIVSALIVGCAGYQKPTSYVHFPEYGYLPVIDDDNYRSLMITYVAYDWYETSGYSTSLGKNIDYIEFSEREALPKSKEEAISIVEKNFSVDTELRMSQLPKDIAIAPIAAPVTLLYWAPGIAIISEYYAHKPNTKENVENKDSVKLADVNYYQKTPVIKHKKVNARFSKEVIIQIIDAQKKGIPEVETLLLMTPIQFEAYADKKGHRTFPKKNIRSYDLPDKLAKILAESIGNEDAPKGMTTDIDGFVRHRIHYNEKRKDLSVLILVRGSGYQPTFVRLPLAEFLGKDDKHRITLNRMQKKTPENSKNPWIIAHKLEQQVLYYTRKYEGSAPIVLADYPSLQWEEFEDLVLTAEKVVPDYPLVSAAMFYYEAERGRQTEAKKYHHYIKDDIYVRAVYNVNWETGLRLK